MRAFAYVASAYNASICECAHSHRIACERISHASCEHSHTLFGRLPCPLCAHSHAMRAHSHRMRSHSHRMRSHRMRMRAFKGNLCVSGTVTIIRSYGFLCDVITHYDSNWLTHWGRVTHICVSKLTIIGSDNGLSPDRRQAIIWTYARILLIWPLGTNFNEIEIEINKFSLKKIHFKMSSGKWAPSCLGLKMLRYGGVITWRRLSLM